MYEELLNKYISDCIQAVKNYRGYMLDNQLLYEIQNKLNEIQLLYEEKNLIFKSVFTKIKYKKQIVRLYFIAKKNTTYTEYMENYLKASKLLHSL